MSVFLVVLGLLCCMGFSTDAAGGGCSLAAVCGLLTGAASLARGHGLWCAQASPVVARVLCSFGSRALGHRLSSVACGTFPDQRSNPGLLHWQADSYSLSHPGSIGSSRSHLWTQCSGPPATESETPSCPLLPGPSRHPAPPRSDLCSHADPWAQSSGPSWPSRRLSWWPPCLVGFSPPFGQPVLWAKKTSAISAVTWSRLPKEKSL